MNIVASYNPYDIERGVDKTLEAIDRSIKDGFSSFSILVPFDDIDNYLVNAEKFKKRKAIYFVHYDYKINLGENNPGIQEKNDAYCKKLIDFANVIDAKLITLHPSTRFDIRTDKTALLQRVIKTLKMLIAYAQEKNINLAIENLDDKRIGDTPEEIVFLLKECPSLFLTLDIAHILLNKQNYLDYYRECKDRISLIQISGISSIKKDYETGLDESEIDLRSIIGWLEKINVPVEIANIYYKQFLQSAIFVRKILNLYKRLSESSKSIPFSAIKAMSNKKEDTISLAQGVSSIIFPENIKQQCNAVLQLDEVFRYTEQNGLLALRKKLAERLTKKYEKRISEKEIVITAGAISGLMCTFLSILNENDEVILLSPTYPSYIEQIILARGKPVLVDLEDGIWSIDIDKVREKITQKTKAIVLCNPSNPLGKVFSKNELESVALLCKEKNIFLISDETYDGLLFGNIKTNNELLYAILQENYVGIYSFSKNMALSGMRIGFVFSDQIIIEEIGKVNDALSICAPAPAQYLLLSFLENNNLDQVISFVKDKLASRREIVCKRLNRLSEFFTYTKPQGANYIFVKLLTTEDDMSFCISLQENDRVSLVPGSAFGNNGKGYVRISIGQNEERLNEAFDRIETYFKRKSAPYRKRS